MAPTVERCESFADIGASRREFNDNRKPFGEGDMRRVRNAFAVAWRKRATFSVFVRIAADANANNAAWATHRVEDVDVGVNHARNLGS